MQPRSREGSEFEEALASLDSYTRRGKHIAYGTINLMDEAIEEASNAITRIIVDLGNDPNIDAGVRQTLNRQLDEMRSSYRLLPYKTADAVRRLPEGDLEISLFGRTMAGKSTLMSILTHADGSQIGKGSQRTTRDVRTYRYHSLKVTDMPGTGAFEGEDDKLAMESVERGDIVVFLFADDAPQLSDATFLSRVKDLGKPVILLFNVKVGGTVREGREVDDIEYLCERIEEKFYDLDELDGTRQSLLIYGPHFQQDWSQIPYTYSHLKSAFLAQDKRLRPWSDELRQASRFDDAIGLMSREVCEKGTFFRLKSYVDTVSTSLVSAIGALFRMCCENLDLSSDLKARREEFANWIERFAIQSQARIDTFAFEVEGELRLEAAAFAEKHFNDREVDRNWRRAVFKHSYDERAQRLFDELDRKCRAEVREISREIDFDIRSDLVVRTGTRVVPRNFIDVRRMAGWTSAALEVGAFALGFINPPVAGVVGIIGAVTGIGSAFLRSGESKRDEARRALKNQLYANISEYVASIKDGLWQSVSSQLIDGILVPVSENMEGFSESLIKLAETQCRLATDLAKRQASLSATLVKEALVYLGYAEMADAVTAAARLPGTTSVLVLNKTLNFSWEVVKELGELLHEGIEDIAFTDAAGLVPISRIAGRALYEGTLTVRQVSGLPVIDAAKNTEDEVSGRLAMQLINTLDVWG